MKTLKELQTLRAALLAEREQLIEQTPELENNWRMGSITHNFLGNPIPAPETTAAMEAVSEAEARIRAITSEIERPNGLNDQVAYLERLAAADDAIAKANADSMRIPRPLGHPFHEHPDSDSRLIRTLIPEPSGH